MAPFSALLRFCFLHLCIRMYLSLSPSAPLSSLSLCVDCPVLQCRPLWRVGDGALVCELSTVWWW